MRAAYLNGPYATWRTFPRWVLDYVSGVPTARAPDVGRFLEGWVSLFLRLEDEEPATVLPAPETTPAPE